MKVIAFNIPKTRTSSIHLQHDHSPYLYDHLHRHKEIQVTTILQSEGTVIVGNYIGRFSPGDVFVLGSNLPHVFRNDEQYYQSSSLRATALSIFFDADLIGEQFWKVDETIILKEFLTTTASGFRIIGHHRSTACEMIQQIFHLDKTERFIGFLQLMYDLLRSDSLHRLSIGELTPYTEAEGSRMNTIVRFTLQESHRKISIEEIAEIAHLTPEAFCRYFKQRTRKTYTQYLNEIRINNACTLLLQNFDSISMVSDRVGFHNLSHFNRVFKKIIGTTPRAFIQQNNSESGVR